MSSTSRIREFVIEGFRKRIHPSKHYVYVIRVINTDGSSFLIQRRFAHFFKLQKQLEKLFPTEAGCIYQNERTLPFLPSNVGIAKHHTRTASEKRMLPLQDYCQRLIGLPPEISECSQVLNFFSQTEDDQRLRDISELDEPEIDIEKVTMIRTTSQPSAAIYRVVEDFTARGDNQVDITENEQVEVIEKLETGWWFVKCYNGRGWVPAVLLESVDGHQEDQTKIYAALGFLGGKEYIAARSYEAQEEDELSFIKGDVMRVLEKRIEGWWMATFSEGRGLVPGNYLKRVNKASAIRLQRDPTIIRRLKGCRTLAASLDNSLSASSDEETESVTSKEAPPRSGRANRPIPPKKPEKRAEKAEEKCYYRSLYDFNGAVNGGSVNMKVGQLVEVITKSEGGWWVVRVGGQEGWVPSAHLVPTDSTRSSTEMNNNRNVKDTREDVNKPTSNPARQEDCNIHYYAPTVLYNAQSDNERGGSSSDQGDEMFWTRNPEEGERFLKSIGQEGTYFIRKSQKSPNNLTLVVSGGDKTNYKYKILHDEANRRYQMVKREFGSLTEIIAFYKSHSLPKIAMRLKRPITSYNVQPFNR